MCLRVGVCEHFFHTFGMIDAVTPLDEDMTIFHFIGPFLSMCTNIELLSMRTNVEPMTMHTYIELMSMC